jgi:hypothetical protein
MGVAEQTRSTDARLPISSLGAYGRVAIHGFALVELVSNH